jgi:uncharacterized protein YjiS (DUF1127 family)
MRKLADLNSLAALDEDAPRGVSTCSDTPSVMLGRASAANDASCGDPADTAGNVEASARHALAADGFGGAMTPDTASSARLTSHGMYHAARADRAFVLVEIIVAAIQAIGAIARRAHARHRQRRQARATSDALRRLDDHILRDLGIDRSEITSVAAEVAGATEYTRVRALQTLHGCP